MDDKKGAAGKSGENRLIDEVTKRILGEDGWLSRNLITIEKALSWVVAIAGLVLGALSFSTDDLSAEVLFVIIATDVMIFFLWGVLSAFVMFRERKYYQTLLYQEGAEHGHKILNLNSQILAEKRKVDELRESKLQLAKTRDSMVNIMASLSRSLSSYLDKLEEAVSARYDEINRMMDILDPEDSADGVPNDDDASNGKTVTYLLEEAVRGKFETRSALFSVHNDYIGDVLDCGRQLVEEYLLTKGFQLKVSFCIKLMLFPDYPAQIFSKMSDRVIYTAFRDKITWAGERRLESPPQLFTIKGNSDFASCLESSQPYIFNIGDAPLIRNESNFYNKLYNCGVTATIETRPRGPESESLVYGFIACDVFCDDKDARPMDENVATMLLTLRNNIALFYEQVDAAWRNLNSVEVVFDEEEAEKSFSECYYEFLSHERSSIENMLQNERRRTR